MGAYKNKKVKQKAVPCERSIECREDPDKFYSLTPAWNFHNRDCEHWAFTKENADSIFWDEILPKLISWESQTWSQILIESKKQNHSIDCTELNSCARKRLIEKHLELDAIISLHINGKMRIYGYMQEHIFNILWFDKNHGDNDTCVCKSVKKHT